MFIPGTLSKIWNIKVLNTKVKVVAVRIDKTITSHVHTLKGYRITQVWRKEMKKRNLMNKAFFHL